MFGVLDLYPRWSDLTGLSSGEPHRVPSDYLYVNCVHDDSQPFGVLQHAGSHQTRAHLWIPKGASSWSRRTWP